MTTPDAGDAGPTADTGTPEPTETVEISGEVDEDTTWTADTLYILTDLTFITNDATLTIEPGTTIQGDVGSALVITRGAQLSAEGTKAQPIVFTSSVEEGDRGRSDWGGVILLGGAEINTTSGVEQVDGIDPTDERGEFGGDDNDGSCGTVKYVRIEFPGYELMPDFELQGLTLAGCGSGTEISYVQVHQSGDDGIEIFGGRPNLDHIVLTGNEDDSFDTALGYVGKVQFMVAQHIAPPPDSGFEFDNQENMESATPRNAPQIYNVTLIGDATSKSPGMVLRRGTYGTFGNFIVMGFPTVAVDVRDTTTVSGTTGNEPALTIKNSLFFDNGPDGMRHFFAGTADAAESTADGDFDDAAYFTDAENGNIVDEDPELGDPTNETDPDFVPADGSPAADAPAPPSGFDTSATYMGAFEPGGVDWTEGWTAYPVD